MNPNEELTPKGKTASKKTRRGPGAERAATTPPVPEASPPAADLFPPVPEPKPLKPIGPAALRALREAIQSGQYPTESAVKSGLGRLLRRPK